MNFQKKKTINSIRKDFPILLQKKNGKPLVYLDSGAISQKPKLVIDTMSNFYLDYCSNVHRGIHELSSIATKHYENTRKSVQTFIGAKFKQEIIFTSGTTASLNLIAYSYGKTHVNNGDEILITEMEHHSNIIPWQNLCKEKKAILKVIPINNDGSIMFDEVCNLITNKTKIVSITHVSNVLGTINPVKCLIKIAHQKGAIVIVDGAQAVHHINVNVMDLNCDFYVFSSHKMYGPTGVGILYGKKRLLKKIPPFLMGGDMVKKVTFRKTTYSDLPTKLEAGTPNIAGIIGLKAAIKYIQSIGFNNIINYEKNLLSYAINKLNNISKITILGTFSNKVPVISLVMNGVHAHDIASILDGNGIATRAGHLCAQPLMERFNISAAVRVSIAIYNNKSDINMLVKTLINISEMF